MRKLIQVMQARPALDGDGVKINRLAGRQLHQILNPFLMIDEINSDDAADYIGGFPEHPHRGFETITYMKAGRMRHRDHMGNQGVISAGDVQWMTAGRGVLHSEMPEQENGLMHGFQIWLNLPSTEKMKPAAYQELASDSIPEQALPGAGLARVIAGDVTINQRRVKGAMPDMTTNPVILDIKLVSGETVDLSFNKDNPAYVYAYQGATDAIEMRHLAVYSPGEKLSLTAGSSGAELLVLSGKPIDEPIVQYGPFVMNSTEEIERALRDFKNPDFLKSLSGKAIC